MVVRTAATTGGFALLAVHIDGFSHHDGIVDDDTQHHDQPEKGDHVDGAAHRPEDDQGAGDGGGDAHAGPEGEAGVEKAPQQQKNDGQPDDAVFQQQIDAGAQHLGIIVEQPDIGTGRELTLLGGEIAVDGPGDLQGILFGGFVNQQQYRRLPVDRGGDRVFGEPVIDAGQPVQGDHIALRTGQDDDGRQLLAGVLAAHGAHADLLFAGADGAAGQVQAAAPHGGRHVVEGDAVLAQLLFGNLDGDFVVARTEGGHLGNVGQLLDLILDLLGPLLDAALGHVAGEVEQGHQVLEQELADDRLFRIQRKGGDGVDLGAYTVEHLVHSVVLTDLDRGRPQSLGGLGGILLDPLEALDGFLDFTADALLHLFGVRSGIRHRNRDHVQGKFGKSLPDHVGGGEVTSDKDQYQHDVGEDGVAGEGGEYLSHQAGSLSVPAAISSRVFSNGSMSRVTITRSPASSPSPT